MAWFRNHYCCARCHANWTDEWSCMCDDDCPFCAARHMSPLKSEDLTIVIETDGSEYVVRRSPETADDDPDYRDLSRSSNRALAEAFLRQTSS